VSADRSPGNKPPLVGRQLWALRLAFARASVAALLGFVVTDAHWEWNALGFLGAAIALPLAIYMLTARSRAGSILTGTAMVAGVFLASLFASDVRGGHGMKGLWIPFIAWFVALAGWALEPRFRSWDRERES
jgi:hypothetical protein